VTVLDDGCDGHSIQPGQTCTITLDYDGSGIVAAATCLVENVEIDLASNAGLAHSFVQSILVTNPSV